MYTLTWTPCWLEVKFIILTQIGTYSLLYRHILRKHVAFLSADYHECDNWFVADLVWISKCCNTHVWALYVKILTEKIMILLYILKLNFKRSYLYRINNPTTLLHFKIHLWCKSIEWREMNNVDRGGVIVLFILLIIYRLFFCYKINN